MANSIIGQSLGWEFTIDSDGMEFVVLPTGDYDFEIVNLERGSFPGSDKMAPGPKVVLTLKVTGAKGTAQVRDDLILNELMMWKLAELFRSVGLKKRGEPMKVNWRALPGAKGRVHLIVRKFTGKDGGEREINAVDHYLDSPAVEPAVTQNSPATTNSGMSIIPASEDEELPFN